MIRNLIRFLQLMGNMFNAQKARVITEVLVNYAYHNAINLENRVLSPKKRENPMPAAVYQ